MENIMLNSKTLGTEISMEAVNGYVTHNALRDIATTMDAEVEYKVITNESNPVNNLVECKVVIAGKTGIEYGESNSSNLDTEIAKQYPALTAIKRAFDRAVIAALQLDGKVYSVEEMPKSMLTSTEAKAEDSKEKKSSTKKTSSKVATPTTENNIPGLEDEKISPVKPEVVVEETVAEKVEEPKTEPVAGSVSLGDTIVLKGSHAGQKFSELSNEWLKWCTTEMKALNKEEEEMIEKAKLYLAERLSSAKGESPKIEAVETKAENIETVEEPIVEEPSLEEDNKESQIEDLLKTVVDLDSCKGKGMTIADIVARAKGKMWLEFVSTNHKAGKYKDEAEKEVADKICKYLELTAS